MRLYTGFICLFTAVLLSCGGQKTAYILTDRPEFALYGEYFNNSQKQYKISVRCVDNLADELKKPNFNPDIIAGSWLKNASTGTHFKALDNLFGASKLSRSIFSDRLLAYGRIDRNQYLLPVSFNIPALIFLKDRENGIPNPFTIGFEDIKNATNGYNVEARGAYTRMGFSPLWDDNFLFLTAVLYGASFKEANPLSWDTAALESSMDYISEWTRQINNNNQAVDDFTFKYFFDPPEKLIQSGRILFSFMKSDRLFTLVEDSKNNLDFRWLMEQNKIPITEDAVFLGIPKKGKSQKAAKAFVQWFFQIDSQRKLLEYSKANRVNETVFGICGGFSALSPVTEQIFPLFYPELLGRMPPSEFLEAPEILPENWVVIKERVVLPYLHDRARKEDTEIYSLEKRLADWTRTNR